jgi:hypothetical protein
MGRRQRRRERKGAAAPALGARTPYADPEGNVLTLRDELSPGAIASLRRLEHSPGASLEDRWQREGEALFERLATSWEIAGLPLTGSAELIGRYRVADAATRAWVRETLLEHRRRHLPELDP